MKKNRTTKLVVIALFIAIVTAVIIAGTFAKYTTSKNVSGMAEVAAWSFNVTDKEGNEISTNVNLADTSFNNVKDKTIAPGTNGGFSVRINPTGSEVSIKYKVVISGLTNKPENLKFYTDDTHATELTANESGEYVFENTLTLPASGVFAESDAVSVPVYWKWDYESGNDTKDTEDAGKDMTFSVSITGTQVEPTSK